MVQINSELVNKLYVCVDSWKNSEPIGRIYSPLAGRCRFGGMLPMIRKMEFALDQANWPQPTHEARSFQPRRKRKLYRVSGERTQGEGIKTMKDHFEAGKSNENGTVQMQGENGEQATFIISVKYRQNSTWQGKIQWVEEKKEQAFRSTLEMIKLMDDALSSSKGEADFDGWRQD